MITRICFLLLTGILSLFSETPKKMIIGVENYPYLPHYDFVDGNPSIAKEILDGFAASQNRTPIYEPLPVKRLHMSLNAGAIDIKYPANAYWGKEFKEGQNIVYSDPVLEYVDGTMVLKPLKGQKQIQILGTIMGFTPWSYRDEIREGKVSLLENANFSALIQQAILNRVDGVYANIHVVKHKLDNVLNMPNVLVFDESLPHIRSHYHLSTIQHPELIRAFNTYLKANTNKIDTLKAKYGVR